MQVSANLTDNYTMNDITQKQNLPRFTNLLKAQRVAYSQCKFCQIFDLVSLVLAIVAPIIGIFRNDLVNVLGAIGVLWTIIYLTAESYRKTKTEQGAKLQEQFDTELYDIPWNDILCKSKVNIDVQNDLATKYSKNDLQDWYSTEIGNTLPKQIAVLICQRINFSWEINLRKTYVNFLIIIVLFYYGIFLIIEVLLNTGIYDILIMLAPSLSFLMYCVQNSLSLKTHIKSKNETLSMIDLKLQEYAQQRSIPDNLTLRQFQDVIFTERTVPEKIPDLFYNFFKNDNENRIDQLVISIKNTF